VAQHRQILCHRTNSLEARAMVTTISNTLTAIHAQLPAIAVQVIRTTPPRKRRIKNMLPLRPPFKPPKSTWRHSRLQPMLRTLNNSREDEMAEQPGDATRFLNHMSQLMREGRNGEAVRLLRAHLDAYPNDTNALHLYGSAAYGDGNYGVAEKVFRAMANMPGAHGVTHYSLGLSLEQLGREREALAAFESALQTNPPYGPARDKVRDLRQKLYPEPAKSNPQTKSAPAVPVSPKGPIDDLVPGAMVPRKAMKGVWVVQIIILLTIPLVMAIGVYAFFENQRRVDSAEKFVCEQAKKNGFPMSPNCARFNLP
jgi:tetratricopeptide (TPR) repeat protein